MREEGSQACLRMAAPRLTHPAPPEKLSLATVLRDHDVCDGAS